MTARLRYVVTLSKSGDVLAVDMEGRSPQLAARAAEAVHPEWTATAVGFLIAGRCIACNCYVFDGPDLIRCGAAVRCSDCP